MARVHAFETPDEAWKMADAIARDAANQTMRAGGRSAWSVDDYNRCAEVFGEMVATFRVLNRWQWLPDGWSWTQNEAGDWCPCRVQ